MIVSDWDRDGRNHASTNGETWCWKPSWLRTQHSVRSWTSKIWYKNQIKNFSIESCTKTVGFPTDTLMGETKRVATQNIKFEVSVNSVWKSVFGTLFQSRFWCNKKPTTFSIDWFVTIPKKFDWNLMQQLERENSEKIELEYRDKSKFIEPFGNFGPSGFSCKEENRHTFNLYVCSKFLFSIETAMEEITPLLT